MLLLVGAEDNVFLDESLAVKAEVPHAELEVLTLTLIEG